MKEYLIFYFFGIKITFRMNEDRINKLAWWIPIVSGVIGLEINLIIDIDNLKIKRKGLRNLCIYFI